MDIDRQIRNCSRCAALLEKHPENPPGAACGVVPRPIVSDANQAPIMLIGQAPGLTEYKTGRPFSGQAGQGIRAALAECGVPSAAFDRFVYQTSAVKCFPGRKRNGQRWEDRQPCARMRDNCATFLKMQIDFVRPRLIVPLGGFASKALDKIRGKYPRSLSEVLGAREHWGETMIVPLTHTSRGNRALNDPQTRARQAEALKLIGEAIAAFRL